MQKITSTTIIKKGDIVVDEHGEKREVLETLGSLVFLEDTMHFKINVLKQGHLIIANYSLDTPVWSAKDLKEGDRYWYINSSGVVDYAFWRDDKIDLFLLKSDNIFETEELAEARLKEILER